MHLGKFKISDYECKINDVLYIIDAKGNFYGSNFVDYDDGCVSCNEREIDDVEVDKLTVNIVGEEEYEKVDIEENKELEEVILEIIEDYVKYGNEDYCLKLEY